MDVETYREELKEILKDKSEEEKADIMDLVSMLGIEATVNMIQATDQTFENASYRECHNTHHKWSVNFVTEKFEEVEIVLHCTRCEATCEMSGDVRTHDYRHIGWVRNE